MKQGGEQKSKPQAFPFLHKHSNFVTMVYKEESPGGNIEHGEVRHFSDTS